MFGLGSQVGNLGQGGTRLLRLGEPSGGSWGNHWGAAIFTAWLGKLSENPSSKPSQGNLAWEL